MKVGDLVRVPVWQLKRQQWAEYRNRGTGVVLEVNPYSVHVLWSDGTYFAHKASKAKSFEILSG